MITMNIMNFSGSHYGGDILEKLCQQRKEGKFCDVFFDVQSQEYPAHQNVLAACSPFFERNGWNSGMNHINVECKNHQVFEIMLNYIYTGTIIIDHTVVEDLILLANNFLISKLKGYCCEYLEKNISVTNCFRTSSIAQKCGLISLSKKVDAFLLANIMEIVQKDEILLFSEKKIHDFISNKTLPIQEEMKIHVINRWVHYKLNDRQCRLPQLLHQVSWEKVNITVTNTILNEDSLYKASEWCLYSMLSIMEEKEVLSSSYKSQLSILKMKISQNSDQSFPSSTSGSCLPGSTNDVKNETGNLGKVQYENQTMDKQSRRLSGPELELFSNIEYIENENTHGKDDQDFENETDVNDGLDFDGDLHQFGFQSDTESPHNGGDDNYMSTDLKEKKVQGRHKRKGIPMKIDHSPVKVRIPKTKLKLGMKQNKKRGRPQKLPSAIQHSILTSGDADPDKRDVESQENLNAPVESESTTQPTQKKQTARSKGKLGRKGSNVRHMSCKDCKFITSSHERLRKHTGRAHKDKTVYTCPLCNYQSSWNREYYNHMKTHFSGPPFLCDYSCGYSGDRIQQLLYHRMTHTDERPFECTVCNMSFRSKNNLTMHMRCHSGVKPFKCLECNRGFATKGTLDQHSVTHSDLRPYLCDLCGFSTKYQSHLIAHKRIHSGDVFKCQYPNCKYFTPKRSQLACHMRTHMSIRSHICSVCGRAFIEKSHLVRHEKIHLEEKPFKCEHCDYSSTRRDKLKDHVIKYHDQTSSTTAAFKPRKARRQTFVPRAFPFLSSEQASSEIHSLLQQSDLVRQQQQRDNPVNILQSSGVDRCENQLLTQTVDDCLNPAKTTHSVSGVIHAINSVTNEVHTDRPGKNTSGPMTTETSTLIGSNSTVTYSSSVQSVIDPRMPMMLGPNQSPILVIPQTSTQSLPSHDYINSGQILCQTLANKQSMPESAESSQVQTQPDFPGLQTFMNIF